MPGFSVENEGVERRLVYRLDEDEYIDTFGYEMVHDNEIEGLLPIIGCGKNGIEEVRYDLQSMMSLRTYLDSSMSKKRLLELFRGVISIIQSTGMYLLDSSMLVFGLDRIFIKSNPFCINMIYLPVVRCDTDNDISELLRTLFRSIIMSARFIVEQDNTYITEILNALNSGQEFSVQEFKSLIDKLDLEVQRRYVNSSDNNNSELVNIVSDYHSEQSDEENDGILQKFSGIFKKVFRRRDKTTNNYINNCTNNTNNNSDYDSLYEVNDVPVFVGEGTNDSIISQDTIMLARSPKEEGIPYITRTSTGENIGLDKNVFRIGKEERYADYLISDNAAVSRVHAEFNIKNGICYLVDEDSLNHTYVNNKKLEAHLPEELKSGDVILFADEEFVFYC